LGNEETERAREMKKQRGDAVLVFMLVVIPALLVLSISLHQKEQREWDAFATEHECVVVGEFHAGVRRQRYLL
jgi:hypothetical protein